MKTVLGIVKVAAGLLLLCVAVLVIALICFEQELPPEAIAAIESRLSTESMLVRVKRVAFRLPHRVRIEGLRLYTREKKDTSPFISASTVEARLRWTRWPLRPGDIVKSVTVTDLRMPRVNEGYYIPDSIEFPGSPDYHEKNEPLDLTFPEIRPFHLRLVRPDILGIRATEINVAEVSAAKRRIKASEIQIRWPDEDAKMELAGEFLFDTQRQVVKGQVHGQARQHNIRPLLVALEIRNSYQFIDAFTGVEPPVDATCRFDVNLVNNDLHIFLDLHPTGGFYRGVPLRDVHGTIDIRVFVRDTHQNARIVVGPLNGTLADGNVLRGSVVYESSNDVSIVHFDAFSNAMVSNVLDIANTLNDGTLSCLQTDGMQQETLRGRLAVRPENAATNRLAGTLQFREGTFFSVPLRQTYVRYDVDGCTMRFTGARASMPRGGSLTGGGFICTPEMRSEHATFGIDVEGTGLALEDLADIFKHGANGLRGKASGNIRLRGPIGERAHADLCGAGELVIRNADLRQYRIFDGLLGLLAGWVPGMDQIKSFAPTDADSASAKFTLTNGVATVRDLKLDGGTLSITGDGTYDTTTDNLDFDLTVRFLRNDSTPGWLLSFVTDPIMKTFFRIQLTGTADDPKWALKPDFRPLVKPVKALSPL